MEPLNKTVSLKILRSAMCFFISHKMSQQFLLITDTFFENKYKIECTVANVCTVFYNKFNANDNFAVKSAPSRHAI